MPLEPNARAGVGGRAHWRGVRFPTTNNCGTCSMRCLGTAGATRKDDPAATRTGMKDHRMTSSESRDNVKLDICQVKVVLGRPVSAGHGQPQVPKRTHTKHR